MKRPSVWVMEVRPAGSRTWHPTNGTAQTKKKDAVKVMEQWAMEADYNKYRVRKYVREGK